MNILVIIPARGGSKGIPRKNIKLFNGKPLIYYSIDCARAIVKDSFICVSSDDDEIISIVKKYDLEVPFKRPAELATDTAGTYDVLLHALKFYEDRGSKIDVVVLLQNTSPFRTPQHVKEALKLYNPNVDMVVSVCEAATNPYYTAFEDDSEGYLHISKGDGHYARRQDAPKVWEYNGAIYIINAESLKKMPMSSFKRRVKYVMSRNDSIDLDTPLDWGMAEALSKERNK